MQVYILIEVKQDGEKVIWVKQWPFLSFEHHQIYVLSLRTLLTGRYVWILVSLHLKTRLDQLHVQPRRLGSKELSVRNITVKDKSNLEQ